MAIEDFRRDEKVEGSTDRFFGILFAFVFLVVACLPLLQNGSIRNWALLVSGIFFLFSLVMPNALSPLNKAWMRFGVLLGHIISPIALGFIYLLSVVPTGLIIKALGKDLLSLKFDRSRESYWIPRETPRPDPKSMKNPF